jgi:DNA-binding FadR family transcriptional regulator
VVAALSDLAERIGAERDLDALLALSIQFQMLIVDHGGSKRLRALIAPFSRIVPGNFYATIPGSAEVTRRGVSELAEAIASGQPDAAEKACWASSASARARPHGASDREPSWASDPGANPGLPLVRA